MADSPSPILQTREQTTGSNTNLWGGYLVTNARARERAIRGYEAYTVTGDATISWTNYSATNSFAAAFTKMGGSPTAAYTITLPSYQTFQAAWNNSGQTGTIKNSGGTGVAIPTGRKSLLFGDGTDIYEASPNWLNNYASTLTNAGDIVVKTTLDSAISAISTAQNGLVLTSSTATTSKYLDVGLAEGTGIDITKTNGGTASEALSIAVDTTELEEFLALTGKITATLSSGTTAMTARRRYRISSTATGTLPTMSAGDFVIVEFTNGAGVTATVARNSQTIDGTAEDDTYIGLGTETPVIRYDYASAGAVTSRLIEVIP